MARHSNETYLEAIRKNDPAVLRDIYRDFYPSIRNYVLKNSGTQNDAKDIFGDAIEVLLRKVKQGNFQLTCKMNTFLTEVGARLWLKKLRRKKFDAGVTTDDPVVLKNVAKLHTPMERTEQYSLYRKMFGKLKENCRQILRLGIVEGKGHREVMEVTGHTYDYSRKMRAKCLKQLIALIKADARYKELKFPATEK